MTATNLGKVAITPRGAYNSAAAYAFLDAVTYGGSSYLALKSITGVTPANDGVNYQLLASQGADGAAGTNGGNGANGNTILSTTGAPSSSTGNNGDYAVDPAAQLIYGPKSGGAWPAGVNYKGDTGATGAGGMTNPMTTAGDMIVGGAAGAPTRVAISTNGYVWTITGGVAGWAPAASGASPYIIDSYSGTPPPIGAGATNAIVIGAGASGTAGFTDTIAVGRFSRATANNSIAIGFGAIINGGVSDSSNSVAMGPSAYVDGVIRGTAIGSSAYVSHDNAVALGNASQTQQNNSVSVGTPAATKTITCVKAGTAPTDAATVGQLCGTDITGTPTRLGQLAVSGGLGYMAVGTTSSADWKQVTN
jgi:hypothetical protein